MINYKKKGFKRTFAFFLVAALLVVTGSVVYWREVTHRLQQDAQVILEATGKELAADVTRIISSQQKILTTLAISLEDDPVLRHPHHLISYLQDQNKYNLFTLTGYQFPDGKTIFSDGKEQQNFLSQGIIEAARKDNFFLSHENAPRSDEERGSLLLVVPVKNKKQPWGTIFAMQPVSSYKKTMDRPLLTDIKLSMVINQQGDVILSHPPAFDNNMFAVIESSAPDKKFPKEEIHQKMAEGKGGIFGYIFRGERRFLSYHPIEYNGWYAVAILPAASIAKKAQFLMLMSMVICLSIISVLAVLLAFILWSERKNSKALYKVGFVDPLTQRDNLNSFQLKFPASVTTSKAQDKQIAIILLNLNRFKALNDIYGLTQGDNVLCEVARMLQEELLAGELCCRIVADRFLLLLSFANRGELTGRIEKLVGQIEKNCHVADEPLPLSVTCGVYVMEEETPFYIMLDRAHLALDTAKQQAGSRYAFYDREYLQKMVTEKRIESNMETALTQRQFKVYLQPKYSFKTGRMVGAEALVRWQHPTQGMIRPDWFIPVFEKNGFVLKLDQYIWQEIISFLKKRQEAHLPVVPIGVNFSRLHLDDPQFIETISAAAQSAGVETRWLEVELTESVVFGDAKRMKQVLDGLHAKGFSVAMDDFGAGYSSLNVLKNLDFDCVKLDKEFLARGETNPRMRQVISGLVKMIKELDSKIVAEGVETEEQAAFLRDIGCDTAQGFLYSRPLPLEEFEAKLEEEKK